MIWDYGIDSFLNPNHSTNERVVKNLRRIFIVSVSLTYWVPNRIKEHSVQLLDTLLSKFAFFAT